MPMFIRSLLVLAAVSVLGVAPAVAGEWLVDKANQQVRYTVDKRTWQPVTTGMTIPNKAWISTGPRGRAVLTRGVETISIQPQTLAAVITTNGLFSRKTEVVQQKGELALDIEKRGRPHTYVHTPFLAAVVKGTSFSVTVTPTDASVSVDEGLVEVSSFTGGQSTDVGPGQSARVDQSQTMSVSGLAGAPAVESVSPTAASVAAVGASAPIGAEPGGSQSAGGGGTSGGQESGSGNDSGNDSGSGSVFDTAQGSESGTGNTADSGDADGTGGGKGNGKGNGNGNGNGNGKGNGNGNGPGNGNGHGHGNGKGNGHGHGHGNGNGN